jgi:thioredoxin reductase/NAD-dependent dihydropyrimidine dehydrogenase PreA subunit
MAELGVILLIGFVLIIHQAWRRNRKEKAHRAELEQNRRDGIHTPPSLHPFIDLDSCIGCGSCVSSCPEHGVLGLVNMQAALVQPDHCVGHGKCEVACPVGAITLVLGSAENGVEVPVTDEFFQTGVPGIYVAGELRGIGLIRNSLLQGMQCLDAICARPRQGRADFDVIIVGAGPAGLGATLQAAAKKLHYLTLEQEDIGGTILKYPRRKLVMTAPVHLPGYGKIYFRDVLKEDLLQEWRKIIAKTGIKIHTHRRVEKIIPQENAIVVVAAGQRFTARNVILALGRRGTPRKLGVPGEQLAKVIYHLDDPQQFAGRQCLVVGGGDSAIECALMLAEAGAEVALSYRQNSITRAKARNRQLLQDAVQKRRIHALMPSVVKEIRPEAVTLEIAGQAKMLHNDDVIVMAGGVLPFEFLKEMGIAMRALHGEPLPGRKVA